MALSHGAYALPESNQIGEIIAIYRVPDKFHSLNGLAWDGEQLWAVDYVEVTQRRLSAYLPEFMSKMFSSLETKNSGGNAYRMDIVKAVINMPPPITRVLDLQIKKMEGAAHNRDDTLYIGPRLDGTRKSARIIALNDVTSKVLKTYIDFNWPDFKLHGEYHDPDGIASDGDYVYWSANGDHADLDFTAVQMMKTDGTITKRFWLPDESVNDIASTKGFLIYKPTKKNVIKMVDVFATPDNGYAQITKTIPITSGTVSRHWGVTYDTKSFLYISQENPGDIIWKIYLPADSIK
jgi:hypothetical protein